MKKLFNLYFVVIISLLVSGAIIALDGPAIIMKAQKQGKNVEVTFTVNKGFGIQKDGPHEIKIYSLKQNFLGKGPNAFETQGKSVYEAKNVKFQGKPAKEDADYFSSVNPLSVPAVVESKAGIRARIYFCSFKDYFCSVQTLNAIAE